MPKIVSGVLPSPEASALWQEFADGGMQHPEIQRRQKETRSAGYGLHTSSLSPVDYWQFVDDAIRGTGGFLDGSYIFPHEREFVRGRATLKKKAYARLEMADYDNFAGVIARAPWGYIVQSADMIRRDSKGVEGLDDFWRNVDGNGKAMLDFLQYPFMQARAYGTAFVRMDRPVPVLNNEAENKATPVVMRALPTSAFRWWTLDADGKLTGLVYCLKSGKQEVIYLWSLTHWVTLMQDEKNAEEYSVTGEGNNPLAADGKLPFLRLHDEAPAFGECLGQSIMLNVAKIARNVYNADSEIVEIRRNCGFPFLGLPMKKADGEAVTKLNIGTSSIVPYDGDGGPPKWVAPELEAMTKLAEYREKKKDQSFGMGHMAAITGAIQTSSGFHSEVEFDKTQQRIGECAGSMEAFETAALDLWALFRGVKFDQGNRPTVEYPREFGIRDLDKVFDRTKKSLDMGLGEEDTLCTLRDFYQARYPRKSKEEIERLAVAGAKAKAEARAMVDDAVQQANGSGGRANQLTTLAIQSARNRRAAKAQPQRKEVSE